MPRQCATAGCTELTDSGICKMCSVERNWGDPGDYNPDGTRADGDFEKAELRDEETRDDDNTHARRNAEQKRIADRELEDDEPEIRTDGGSVQIETDVVEEWQAVPTRSHPDADVDERYPCTPGPSAGLTEAKARELARGRNRSGEPSPAVQWHAEPTGREKPRDDLFDVDSETEPDRCVSASPSQRSTTEGSYNER